MSQFHLANPSYSFPYLSVVLVYSAWAGLGIYTFFKERERESKTERDRNRETVTLAESWADRHIHTERHRQTDRNRDTQRDDKDRQTETQRQRQRQRVGRRDTAFNCSNTINKDKSQNTPQRGDKDQQRYHAADSPSKTATRRQRSAQNSQRK